MKVTLDINGPDYKWDFAMNYYNMSEIYAWELASAAANLASYIGSLTGGAPDDASGYSASFHLVVDGKEPKIPAGVKGQVKADRLLFSQATDIQAAGAALLARLLESQQLEVKSGLRT